MNIHGQLGNNSTVNSIGPVAVDASGALADTTVTAVSAGGFRSCAVADGRAYCWGSNDQNHFSDTSPTDTLAPVSVDTSGVLSGKTVTAISAGNIHTCAVADGRAYCWGSNYSGALGNNSTVDSSVPVAVDTSGVLQNKTVTAISAGGGHTCVVADGRAYCWGSNRWGGILGGQLGNNSTTDSLVPVAVDTSGKLAGKTVTSISAGGGHTCAIADGRAYCWGANGWGQLGNNSTANSFVPVALDTSGVLQNKAVTVISAGGSHTCAVADGRAYCWGDNQYGQLGKPGITRSKVPVAVDTRGSINEDTVTAISAGGPTSCAVAAGRAHCWGNAGEVLDWAYTPWWRCSQVPVAVDTDGVLAGKGVTQISAGTGHVLALTGPLPPPTSEVTGVKATVAKGRVKVTWNPVTGAISYRVRISKPGGTKYKAWKTTTKRVFKAKLEKGKKYRLQVFAVNAAGRGPVTTIRFKGK